MPFATAREGGARGRPAELRGHSEAGQRLGGTSFWPWGAQQTRKKRLGYKTGQPEAMNVYEHAKRSLAHEVHRCASAAVLAGSLSASEEEADALREENAMLRDMLAREAELRRAQTQQAELDGFLALERALACSHESTVMHQAVSNHVQPSALASTNLILASDDAHYHTGSSANSSVEGSVGRCEHSYSNGIPHELTSTRRTLHPAAHQSDFFARADHNDQCIQVRSPLSPREGINMHRYGSGWARQRVGSTSPRRSQQEGALFQADEEQENAHPQVSDQSTSSPSAQQQQFMSQSSSESPGSTRRLQTKYNSLKASFDFLQNWRIQAEKDMKAAEEQNDELVSENDAAFDVLRHVHTQLCRARCKRCRCHAGQLAVRIEKHFDVYGWPDEALEKSTSTPMKAPNERGKENGVHLSHNPTE